MPRGSLSVLLTNGTEKKQDYNILLLLYYWEKKEALRSKPPSPTSIFFSVCRFRILLCCRLIVLIIR
jgi:hypothetical protein